MKNFINIDYLKNFVYGRKVVLWGASNFLKSLFQDAIRPLDNVIGIVDNNTELWGTELAGYRIYSPRKLSQLSPDAVLLTIQNNNDVVYESVKRFLNENQIKIELLPNIFYNEENALLRSIKKSNNEILYSNIFFNLVNNCEWIKKKDFVPVNSAANCSLLLTLFSVLEYMNPQNILELGMGQTSKLTTQYVNNKNADARLHIVEHDEKWLNYFSKQLNLASNVFIYKQDLTSFFYNGSESTKYDGLLNVISEEKFDLIIVDGPIGYKQLYPRTNVLELIPNNIADDFVVLLDDVQRIGEKNTLSLFLKKLKEFNILYDQKIKQSTKDLAIITSQGMKYATYY